MLMCNESVTLIHLERYDDGEKYNVTIIENASWYGKRVMTQTTKGAEPQNTYMVRIPDICVPDPLPAKGDYMVRGAHVSEVKRIPADIAEEEYFCITTVGDNRRGRLKHMVVSGA